jgi:peptidoglycan/LPS O-acetylase OafA/YrhL
MATGKGVIALVSIAALLLEIVEIMKRLLHGLGLSLYDIVFVGLSLVGLCLAGSEALRHARTVREKGVRQAFAQLLMWLLLLVGCYYGIRVAVQFAPIPLVVVWLLFLLGIAIGTSGDRPLEKQLNKPSHEDSSTSDGGEQSRHFGSSFDIHDV